MLELWYQAMKLTGTLDAESLSNPLAGAIIRLEMLSRRQGDPVAAKEEEEKLKREIDAQDDWDDATVGDGYNGARGRIRYGGSNEH